MIMIYCATMIIIYCATMIIIYCATMITIYRATMIMKILILIVWLSFVINDDNRGIQFC